MQQSIFLKKGKKLCSRHPLTHTKGIYLALFLCHPNPNSTANPSHHQMNQNPAKKELPSLQATCVLSRNGTHTPPPHAWVAQSRMMSASCLHKASINAVQLCCWAGKPTLPPPVGPSPAPLRSPSSVLAVQLCLTLCIPRDHGPPGSSVHEDSPGQNTGLGLPCPPPGDLPHSETEPGSPTLQADSLPSEPPGKPSPSSEHLVFTGSPLSGASPCPWLVHYPFSFYLSLPTRQAIPGMSLHPGIAQHFHAFFFFFFDHSIYGILVP